MYCGILIWIFCCVEKSVYIRIWFGVGEREKLRVKGFKLIVRREGYGVEKRNCWILNKDF